MTKHHRVAIVFDEHAGRLLPALASRCHVWLVDSDENSKAAQDYWEQARRNHDELASGVTTFTRHVRQPDDALDTVLELVEDHHGEFGHDPPIDEVLIIGLGQTAVVSRVLKEWGYTQIQRETEGLVGRRE